MKFEDALKAMREGKTVKRRSDPAILYIDQYGDIVLDVLEVGFRTIAIFTQKDIFAEDWEVVS